MNYGKAAFFGMIAGLAGAALWAAIAYYANYEIGWLAWGIGLAVGWATVKGASAGSPYVGLLAVVITVFSLLLGKVAMVEMVVNNDFGDPETVIVESIAGLNDEMLTSYLADELVTNREEAGEAIVWPEGVDPTQASTQAEYPADIWAGAAEAWQSFTDEEKQDYRVAVEEYIRESYAANFGAFQEAVRQEGFLQSFSGMDVLFFGLAICTAFSVGKSGEIHEKERTAEIPPTEQSETA
ncbi:hypothetical protein [Bythopirellula goksoeyrii]|uniref:Uncharacterized protein n=1 Tax=Bythopirellula goksoeyrii TaxID=1400387 RepID=A0A5B9QGN5_9BACT|nr:hypothetical protein [Bythopirellula goksoeyrii]QEG37944.1 hypothetical protein Pr1d_52920 [Bythopirellula goksoeyrii]